MLTSTTFGIIVSLSTEHSWTLKDYNAVKPNLDEIISTSMRSGMNLISVWFKIQYIFS